MKQNYLGNPIAKLASHVQNMVEGTNWVVKVRIGEGITDYLHFMINQIVNV